MALYFAQGRTLCKLEGSLCGRVANGIIGRMKPNKYMMQGFLPPLLDDSRPSARNQSFQARKKRQQRRKHIGAYESARVVHSYGQHAMESSKRSQSATEADKSHDRRRHNHTMSHGSMDIVRPAPVRHEKPAGGRHRFTEPSSRKHP